MKWNDIENGKIKLQLADLVHCHNSEKSISQMIRYMTRRKGETPTFSNHTTGISGIIKMHKHYRYRIIEAINGKVRERDLLLNYRNQEVIITRHRRLTDQERLEIVTDCRNRYKGRIYSYSKIGLQTIDKAISKFLPFEFYFFSRFGFPFSAICSQTWADPYDKAGINFNAPPKAVDPDQILDYILTHLDVWYIVFISDGAEEFLQTKRNQQKDENFEISGKVVFDF